MNLETIHTLSGLHTIIYVAVAHERKYNIYPDSI